LIPSDLLDKIYNVDLESAAAVTNTLLPDVYNTYYLYYQLKLDFIQKIILLLINETILKFEYFDL